VSESNGTFKQLLVHECTGLRESKIPFVIRASEFKANSEPKATHRSMVFTVSCAEADVVTIQNHLDLYKKKEGHQKRFFTLQEWLGFTDSTKVNVLRQNNDWTKCYRRITLSGVKDLSTVMSVQDAVAPGGVARMTIEEFLLQVMTVPSHSLSTWGGTLPKHTRTLNFTHPLTIATQDSGRMQPRAGYKTRLRYYYKEFQTSDTE
jgi:hypothetical protein